MIKKVMAYQGADGLIHQSKFRAAASYVREIVGHDVIDLDTAMSIVKYVTPLRSLFTELLQEDGDV